MKRIISFSLLCFVLLTFYGCPVSSTYPLGKPGEHKIDTDLLGKWVTKQADHEANEVAISKKDDYLYDIQVIGKGDMYMAEKDRFTAWITKIEDKTFLCLKESETTYYVYSIDKIGKNEFETNDITLKVKGTDAITSIEAYREEVIASMKFDDFLASKAFWTRK